MKTSRTSWQHVLSKREGCGFGTFFDVGSGGGGIGAELYNGSSNGGTGAALPADGKWHHVAFQRQGTTTRMYVDGVLGGQGTTTGVTNMSNGAEFLLGTSPCSGSTAHFNGELDEVVLYTRALTAAEVATQAQADVPGDACDPCPTNGSANCGLSTCTDADGDGYGISGAAGCSAGNALDCNATDAAVHPGAAEVCDGIDNNCDLRVDEGCPARVTVRYTGNGLPEARRFDRA